MKIQYRFLQETDAHYLPGLFRLFNEVFETDHPLPGNEHFKKLLQNKNILFLIAVVDEKVIAGITAHLLPSFYTSDPEMYIYDVAVHREYRRFGIGKYLMSALNTWCKKNNIREVFVQADSDDRQAVTFYKATGGVGNAVIHFTYSLKK